MVGTCSIASPYIPEVWNAVERVPTKFRGAMREFVPGGLSELCPSAASPQGSSPTRNPYMSLDMSSGRSRSSLGPTGKRGCSPLRGSPQASVASRRGIAQRGATGETCPRQSQRPSRVYPHLVTAFLSISCFSCAGKKMRPLPLRKGQSAACASSCNPRTALGQSVAQPEPRTPGAPNSNGCQSGGQARQLV